jgi:hypothetical protein
MNKNTRKVLSALYETQRTVKPGKRIAIEGDTRLMQLYQFIIGFKKTHDGNSPTYRETAKSTGITMTYIVVLLRRLQDMGLIVL